jgi:hydrogenase nickel incorporation protein HypA/HybF
MHETGIVRDLVHRLERSARDAGALRVQGVTVWLGALSQFSPVHFRAHFDEEAAGTLAEGAALTIETSEDFTHRDALHVIMRSADLELPADDPVIGAAAAS